MSIKIDHARFDSTMPDIAEPALIWFNEHVSHTDTLFEWGSGGSTFWFADRVKKVYSVEHHPAFFAYVKEHYLYENYDNIQLGYAPIDVEADLKYLDYFDQYSYKRYCYAIEDFPSRSFDWVIVNGKARAQCLDRSLLAVKTGGVIIINDTDKIEYGSAVSKYYNKAVEVIELKGAKMPYARPCRTTIMRMP